MPIDASHVMLGVNECDQGHTDLNGDGDGYSCGPGVPPWIPPPQPDLIRHVWNIDTDDITNLQAHWESTPVQAGPSRLAMYQTLYDPVRGLYVWTAQSGLVSVDSAGGNPVALGDGRIAYNRRESSVAGGTDLNGDGDTLDWVAHVLLDDATNTIVNLGVASGGVVPMTGGKFAVGSGESSQNIDANGDGLSSSDGFIYLAKPAPGC